MSKIGIIFLMLLLPGTTYSANLEARGSKIAQILKAIQTQHPYPGVSLAIAHGDELYTDNIGYANVDDARAIDSETIFRVYSLSKGVTAILANILSQRKILDLDLAIVNYLSELPAQVQEITSQQLLSHRGGIRHYHGTDEWLKLSREHCARTEDALNPFINDPLIAEPGAGVHYSSFGYVLLSAVLTAAAGETFDSLLHKYIIAPSGAGRTELDIPGRNVRKNVATYYEPVDGRYLEAPAIDNSCKFGGGAINSTAADIAKIYQAYFAGKLTNESASELASSLPGKFTIAGEGLGGRAALVAYPQEQLVVVILANTRGGDLQPHAVELAELLLDLE